MSNLGCASYPIYAPVPFFASRAKPQAACRVWVGRKTSLYCAKRLLFHATLEVILIKDSSARKRCVPGRALENPGLPAATAMSTSKMLFVCLVVVSAAAAAGSPVKTQLIANGGFETVAAGTFDSWTSSPGSGVASASAAPTVIGGSHSARLLAGGGSLLQTVSTDGIGNFAMELDFAVLDTASTGLRSFGIVTYSAAGVAHSGSDNIDSIRVYTTPANRHQIQVYGDGGFQDTGLFVKATPDINGDLKFDDGRNR